MTEPEENREKTPKTDAVLDPRELRHPPSTANPSRTRVPPEGIRQRRDEDEPAEPPPATEEPATEEEG